MKNKVYKDYEILAPKVNDTRIRLIIKKQKDSNYGMGLWQSPNASIHELNIRSLNCSNDNSNYIKLSLSKALNLLPTLKYLFLKEYMK